MNHPLIRRMLLACLALMFALGPARAQYRGDFTANGTTTGGTTLATLPASFRPVSAVRFRGLAYLNNIVNGSPWADGVFLVNGAGEIQVQFLPAMGAGSFLQFDGTSFSIRP